MKGAIEESMSGTKEFSVTGDLFVIGEIGAARVEDSVAISYRLAKLPNGETVLQGAFRWHQGMNGGIDWRNIQTVRIDQNGCEL